MLLVFDNDSNWGNELNLTPTRTGVLNYSMTGSNTREWSNRFERQYQPTLESSAFTDAVNLTRSTADMGDDYAVFKSASILLVQFKLPGRSHAMLCHLLETGDMDLDLVNPPAELLLHASKQKYPSQRPKTAYEVHVRAHGRHESPTAVEIRVHEHSTPAELKSFIDKYSEEIREENGLTSDKRATRKPNFKRDERILELLKIGEKAQQVSELINEEFGTTLTAQDVYRVKSRSGKSLN